MKINKTQAPEDKVAEPPAEKEKEELKAHCDHYRVSVPPRPLKTEDSSPQDSSQSTEEEDSEEEAGHYYQGLGWLFGLIGKCGSFPVKVAA